MCEIQYTGTLISYLKTVLNINMRDKNWKPQDKTFLYVHTDQQQTTALTVINTDNQWKAKLFMIYSIFPTSYLLRIKN